MNRKRVALSILLGIFLVLGSLFLALKPYEFWNLRMAVKNIGSNDCGVIRERASFEPGTSIQSYAQTAEVYNCFNENLKQCSPSFFKFKYSTVETYWEETYYTTQKSLTGCRIVYDTWADDIGFSKTSNGKCDELVLLEEVSSGGYGYLSRAKCKD
ncbi:hypothetical protein A2397_01190 [Candidatus Amesbacteria bacterium RIFOXYB1_FULL_44_23]|uniref:Uncharacterized protein n=1 Tax=Candidatus Amesbacteria bacterium RIFOXYB1_FULL_44_23 TaxID=1797263 RepID=A0A1F4ZW40_9BACT|nr:MAG: hypothetical protein A2397_01190 [Candidatus Amesbacteria bacterium RIFOXYB1_FULL_44_23]